MGTSQVLPSSWRSSELLDWFGGCIREICAKLDDPVKPVSRHVDMDGDSKLDSRGRNGVVVELDVCCYTRFSIDLTTVPWEVPRPAAALVNISEPTFMSSILFWVLWYRPSEIGGTKYTILYANSV